MTLEEAIGTARSQSVAALQAKHAFVSTYWAYRSYQASRLPSLNLYGNLMNFDRSLTLLQSYEDGTFRYANSYNLQNSLGLSVAQNVTFTGGRLSVYSDLRRIDQYGAFKNLTWYSQPITVSYYQPLFAYNQFKWDKLIEPKEYERGRRQYIESMEEVTIAAAKAYFDLIAATRNHEASVTNFANTVKMRSVAGERLKLGTVTRDEYLQLELRALNDSIAMGENLVKVREAQMALNSILGYDESVEVLPVIDDALPEILMDYDMVLDKALKNSTFNLENDIKELNAASAVAKAKADRGISMSLNARFGLSQSGAGLPDVYRDLLNQEVVGLTFSVPIFDNRRNQSNVKTAKLQQLSSKLDLQDRKNTLSSTIEQYWLNANNGQQNYIAAKARVKSQEASYELLNEQFQNGLKNTVDVLQGRDNVISAEQDMLQSKYMALLNIQLLKFYTGEKIEL